MKDIAISQSVLETGVIFRVLYDISYNDLKINKRAIIPYLVVNYNI